MPSKPPTNGKAKRHKKRKSRTEVSSDISSSEDERSQSEIANSAARTDKDAMDLDSAGQGNDISKPSHAQSQSPPSPASSSSSPSPPPTTTKINPKTEMETSFQKFYMQKVAEEFAEDLDAIRGAGDFGDGALESLIEALRQGTGVFGVEEMRRVVGGGSTE